MSLRDQIATLLRMDATVAAKCAGGVLTGSELNRSNFPGSFDAKGQLLPSILVTLGEEVPSLVYHEARVIQLQIQLYQQHGFSVIDEIRIVVHSLLDYKRPISGVWQINPTSDTLDIPDEAVESDRHICRFEIVRLISV